MRITRFFVAAAIAASLVAGPAGTATADVGIPWRLDSVHTSSYETSLDGWAWYKDANLRDGNVTRSATQAQDGSYGLKFYLDGLNDDGTLWVRKQFARPDTTAQYKVEVSFWVYSGQQSNFNTWPIFAYIGSTAPAAEEDFTSVGQTDGPVGWAKYTHVAYIQPEAGATFEVAYGLSATWEVQRDYYLDNAEVKIYQIG
ncbi:hypothetical protein [Longispora albida]|uniref:hypothetical protein n=1 Tax=Longispora albida TaxID=203523 RepID=UPI00035F0CB2|nr:hypothetical protein [Longispora albida]